MFEITGKKGFRITFSNGYRISCQFGGFNFCQNYLRESNIGLGHIHSCPDCEVGITSERKEDEHNKWVTKEIFKKIGIDIVDEMNDETTAPNVTPDQVAKIITYLSSQE